MFYIDQQNGPHKENKSDREESLEALTRKQLTWVYTIKRTHVINHIVAATLDHKLGWTDWKRVDKGRANEQRWLTTIQSEHVSKELRQFNFSGSGTTTKFWFSTTPSIPICKGISASRAPWSTDGGKFARVAYSRGRENEREFKASRGEVRHDPRQLGRSLSWPRWMSRDVTQPPWSSGSFKVSITERRTPHRRLGTSSPLCPSTKNALRGRFRRRCLAIAGAAASRMSVGKLYAARLACFMHDDAPRRHVCKHTRPIGREREREREREKEKKHLCA